MMPSILRRLFAILSALSLMLCIVAVGLWVRSYHTADWLTYQWTSPPDKPYSHHRWSMLSVRGFLTVRFEFVSGGNPQDADNEEWLRNQSDDWAGLRISHDRGDAPWADEHDGVIDSSIGIVPLTVVNRTSIPIRFAAIVTILLMPCVVWCHFAIRRMRRPPIGLCHTCGYDLRASKEKCPECGTTVISVSPPTGAPHLP